MAPIHKRTSGLGAFFTITGNFVPRNASVNSCTTKGLAVLRAPIHTASIP